MNEYSQSYPNVVVSEQSFIRRVYNWMTAGLGLSALVAWYLMNNEAVLINILRSQFLTFGLFIGQLGIALWLSARIHRMGAGQATFLFFLYAGITGLAISPIFLAYTKSSIVSVLFITGATFGSMSLYGYMTKRDLTSVGSFAVMALWGVIIAELVNWFFLQSAGLNRFIPYVAVAAAVGLTAYDTQIIKRMSQGNLGDEEMQTKAAIMGAFRLYLDFVIMFVNLLRILGNRR